MTQLKKYKVIPCPKHQSKRGTYEQQFSSPTSMKISSASLFHIYFYTMNEVLNKQIIQNYREIPKTFMEELYFYYGVKMVKTAVENRTLNLPRKSGQQVSHFHNSKSICPKILQFHRRIQNSMIYNFGIIHSCIRGQNNGVKQG